MTMVLSNGMCRCCASEGTFKDVRSKYHWMGEEEVYAVMLKDCLNITLTEECEDGGICEVCITQLRNAANFKKQVLNTEEQLKRNITQKTTKSADDELIKMEEANENVDEADGFDNFDEGHDLSDPDYTLGVKEEKEIKEELRSKRRSIKAIASTSRVTSPESTKQAKPAAKRHAGAPKIHRKRLVKEENDEKIINIAFRQRHMPEMKKQWHNLTTLLKYSNATPFKDRNDAGFTCAYCFKTYPNPDYLRTHTNNDHIKEKPTYKASSGMASFVVFLDIVDLKCKICEQPMEHLKSLSEHLVNVHSKTYYLEVTDYFQPFKLTSEPQMKCCLCEEVYHNMKLLMQHMNAHYRNFICTTCGAGFVNSFRLNRHEMTHAKKKSDFPCRLCSLTFNVESKRKAHVNTEHKGIAGDSVCQICKARFKNYYQKTRHMIQVHNMEGIKCDLCEKKFNLKSNLMLHMRSVHLKERPYECSVCSMGFFIKRHMVGHYMATHTNERKYKCDVCSKAYATQNSKRKHMRKNHGITKNSVPHNVAK